MNLLPAESDEKKSGAMTALEVAVNRGGWSLRSLYYSYQEKRYVCTLSRLIQNGGGRRRITESESGYGDTMSGAILDAASGVAEELVNGADPEDAEGDWRPKDFRRAGKGRGRQLHMVPPPAPRFRILPLAVGACVRGERRSVQLSGVHVQRRLQTSRGESRKAKGKGKR